jgi:hypothetical protein
LDICKYFGTGIDKLAEYFPSQNQVLSRLVDDKKCQKSFLKLKTAQNELLSL